MKKYKIKKFCDYMGVTPDTVKHYQNCGILAPLVDPENSYRYYNITHGERLIVSRKFRNLGFSVEDTSALISQTNGMEVKAMLEKRQAEVEEELARLTSNYENIQYLNKICDLFNHKCGTYIHQKRPAYYFYRHTYNFEFIDYKDREELTKELMAQLPNAVKMLVVPYETLMSRKNQNFYHTLAIPEAFSHRIKKEDLDMLEYIPEKDAILYVYSRPHSHNKYEVIHDIFLELQQKGYSFSKEDIVIENAIDYYENGIRYENYLIYFTLA